MPLAVAEAGDADVTTIPDTHAHTPLERAVLRALRTIRRDTDDDMRSLSWLGVRWAIAGTPTFRRRDAVRFYRNHEEEILSRMADCVQRRRAPCEDIFGAEWDTADPLARGTNNQTTLARFGFADAVQSILERMEKQA